MIIRFHTSHLLGIVLIAAIVCGLVRHPDALRPCLVALIGGVCVVLPALGTAEWLRDPNGGEASLSWPAALAVLCVAVVGLLVACILMLAVLSSL